ncbi:hypothetical protein [[Eubacterium] cellulosolvens]
MANTKEYVNWLQAHIAMQRELLKGQSKEYKEYKRGHIALLELKLREVRKELRGKRKK